MKILSRNSKPTETICTKKKKDKQKKEVLGNSSRLKKTNRKKKSREFFQIKKNWKLTSKCNQ